MYEDQTYDIILERMMNRVSDKIDKRPSSPVYDLHSSTAIEFQILYIELEYLIKNSSVTSDNLPSSKPPFPNG